MRIQELIKGLQSPAEIFINAVNGQAQYSTDLPYVLSFAPLARMNPFQRLLYSRAKQSGYAVVPASSFSNLISINWSVRSIIHLHWLASILLGCATSAEATERINAFEQEVLNWKRAGHFVVWTLHNILPHDREQFLEHEIRLRKVIVKHCDAIHIMSEGSVDEARQYYDIPTEKVFLVPHPSYEGWYANVGDRSMARLDLGLDSEVFTFVQFGSLQPYKGVLELIQTFKELKKRYPNRNFRLIIAGAPSDKKYVKQVIEASLRSYDIRVVFNTTQENEIQTFFNAADVVVAPYVRALNSGISLLAATFKKPFVAPRAAGVVQTFYKDQSLLYDQNEKNGLLEALERSLSYQIRKEVFDDILNCHRPENISSIFFDCLTQRVLKKQEAVNKGVTI